MHVSDLSCTLLHVPLILIFPARIDHSRICTKSIYQKGMKQSERCREQLIDLFGYSGELGKSEETM